MAINLEVPDQFKVKRESDPFSPFTITRASCGLYHSLVVGKRGEVPQLYGWGRNHNNVLALGSEVLERAFPAQVSHFAKCHIFQVSCGLNHTVVIVKQYTQVGGKVYSCGLGNKGRLGFTKTNWKEETADTDAWFTPKPIRVRFPNKEKIVRVSCGSDHTLAISDHGELFGWGVGQYGNLGTGEVNDEYAPVKIHIGGPDAFVIHCCAGGKHSLACTIDGRCYSWGHGGNGRLGLGHSRAVLSPTSIEQLAGREIVFVSAGEAHSACIDKTGVLYTWGAGGYGRLGHGEDSDLPVPRKVEEFGGISIVQVACGTFHTMAVSRAGILYGWGAGLGLGLVAEGDNTAVLVPKQVREGGITSTVCQVAIGTYHTIALTLTGDVFCWGVGGQSRLGHGDNVNQPFPKHVAELRNKAFVDDIKRWFLGGVDGSAGIKPTLLTGAESWRVQSVRCGQAHTMILTAIGDIWVWGSNAHGQLGLGESYEEDCVYEPVLLDAFKDPIRRIACGQQHSLAVNLRGELFVWGDGSQGQLGLGRIVDAYVPTGVLNIRGVFDVCAGDDYSACLVAPHAVSSSEDAAVRDPVYAEAGDLWTWGSCEAGKLGHEGLSSGSCVAPKKVKLSVPISKISCGRNHMIACSPNGEVFTWGAGYYGRLGIGSSANSPTPVRVPFPDDVHVTDVASGQFHSLALTSQGVLWVWGRDVAVCADDHLKFPTVFEQLESPEGVPRCKAIAAYGDHSFAVTLSGQAWAWGENKKFQLGCGKKSSGFVDHPELLISLPDSVELISTSENHTVAVLRSGDVFSWGANNLGCLGIGFKKTKFVPSPEPVVTHWISIEQRIGGPVTGHNASLSTPNQAYLTTPRDGLGGSSISGASSPHTLQLPSYVQATGEYATLDVSNEQRVTQFLDRLRFPSDTSTFATAQELLKTEAHVCRAEELAALEDDLIKIFGRLLDVILKMPETEAELHFLETLVERKLARFVVNLPCDAPNVLENERGVAPDFYLWKLPAIQKLISYLQMQPSYLVHLAAAIKRDYERQTLLATVKQLYWNIEDRHVNAAFLSLCAAVCAAEIESAPDLLRLFRPEDSNFIQLFALYATQLPNLIHFGAHLIDPTFEGGAGNVVNRLDDLILVLDITKLQEFNPETRGEPDKLQKLFHRSLEGIQTVVSSLGAHMAFPVGIAALLKHAYDHIVARDFAFDTLGGAGANLQYCSYYPLVRLVLQGMICRVWKEPILFNKYLRAHPFTAGNAEVNFRTLWIFLNSAFEDDFAQHKASHLFREIFQIAYMKTVELVIQTVSNTPDDYIRVELTLSLYTTHFDITSYVVTLKSDVVASLVNLLKDHEAHLQLSVYDPVTEVMKTLSGGKRPVFSREMLEHLEAHPYYHNVRIDRRFLLKERNAVFDATTGAPVPQRLAPRQQAAVREGRSVIALVHRYVPADPLDPRAVIEEALRVVPSITARDWGSLHKQLLVLQEFFSRQSPPDFTSAQLAAKAAKHANDFENQEVPPVTGLKWIGEGLRRRQRHRTYLAMVQIGEDTVADAERKYQFEIRKRLQELNEVVQLMGTLYIEPAIREKLESEKLTPQIDVVANYCGREADPMSDYRPTVTLPLKALIRAGIVVRCVVDPNAQLNLSFTSRKDGGWTVQIVECLRGGDREVDKFDIPPSEIARLTDVPFSSDVSYGNKLVNFQVAGLLHFFLRASVQPIRATS